jgi:S1-C subfamily serine protease
MFNTNQSFVHALILRFGFVPFFILLTISSLMMAPVASAVMLTGGIEASVALPAEKGIVGMDIDVPRQGYPQIKQVFSHAPAAQAGLLPGDRIIKINGQLVFGFSTQAVDLAISDVPGTPISFTIQRGAAEYKTLMLVVMPLSATERQVRSLYPQVLPHVAHTGINPIQ